MPPLSARRSAECSEVDFVLVDDDAEHEQQPQRPMDDGRLAERSFGGVLDRRAVSVRMGQIEYSHEPDAGLWERRGWVSYEFASTAPVVVMFAGFLPNLLLRMCESAVDENGLVHAGLTTFYPAAFVAACRLLQGALQIFMFACFSAFLDFGGHRKRTLIVCAAAGATCTIGVAFVQDDQLWWLVGLLLILGKFFHGASVVAFNAYLPMLARNDTEVKYREDPSEHRAALEGATLWLSVRGTVAGFVGGAACLLACFPFLAFVSNPALGYRLSSLIAGCWWAGFSVFAAVLLKRRLGPPLAVSRSALAVSLSRLRRAVGGVRRLPNAGRFLLGYLVASDAFAGIAAVGAYFADQTLQRSGMLVALLVLEIPVAAVLGALALYYASKRFGVRPLAVVQWTLWSMAVLCVYVLLGVVPGSRVGLRTSSEMYAFGFVFGFCLGGFTSFSRSILAHMTPDGCEGAFFGFFEAASKGSSIIVPAISATLSGATGELRYGMIPPIVAFLVASPVLLYVNVADGYHEAKVVAQALNEPRTPSRRKARRASEGEASPERGAGMGESPPPAAPTGIAGLPERPASARFEETPVRGIHRRTPSNSDSSRTEPGRGGSAHSSARRIEQPPRGSCPPSPSRAAPLRGSCPPSPSRAAYALSPPESGPLPPRCESIPSLAPAPSAGSDAPLLTTEAPASPINSVAPALPAPPTPHAIGRRYSNPASRPASFPATPRPPTSPSPIGITS